MMARKRSRSIAYLTGSMVVVMMVVTPAIVMVVMVVMVTIRELDASRAGGRVLLFIQRL